MNEDLELIRGSGNVFRDLQVTTRPLAAGEATPAALGAVTGMPFHHGVITGDDGGISC